MVNDVQPRTPAHKPNIPLRTLLADTVTVSVVLLLTCVSLVYRRLFPSKDADYLTLSEDARRSFLRGICRASIPTISRSLKPTRPEPILNSARFRKSSGTLLTAVERPGFKGYWLCQGPPGQEQQPDQSDAVILWFHGGAYCFADALHGAVSLLYAAEAAAREGVRISILSVEYGLSPASVLRQQQREAMAAFHYLTDEMGVPSSRVIIGGESAGAHLALVALVGLALAHSDSAPGGALLLSPWVNLLNDCESFNRNKSIDTLDKNLLDRCARAATGTTSREELAREDLANLTAPPAGLKWSQILPRKTGVQMGTQDMMGDDVKLFVSSAREQGASIQLEVSKQQPHGWLLWSDSQNASPYLDSAPGTHDPSSSLYGGEEIARQILDLLR